MKVVFRVDASHKVGTGHLMRCLTLAEALAPYTSEISFISRTAQGDLHEFVRSKGVEIFSLPTSISINDDYCPHSSWLESHWQEDVALTSHYLSDTEWLIVDSYAIDSRWEEALRGSYRRLMVIDDLADRSHRCDLLLDQNYYTDSLQRYETLVNQDCNLLLGPHYALLRDEFKSVRSHTSRTFTSTKRNVLVFFGGADCANETGKALAGLSRYEGEVIVVVGKSNPHYLTLQKFCENNSNFSLLRAVDNMAQIMASVDVAIGAGGATTLERMTLGLPSLCWPIALNQVKVIQDLSSAGVVKLTTPEDLCDDINLLQEEELRSMSTLGSSMCDANGCQRVVARLLELSSINK
jgi:UDP-2,4-diacetamido-2,4,6-trideoxy-beta-L-altropyranose hydrolase